MRTTFYLSFIVIAFFVFNACEKWDPLDQIDTNGLIEKTEDNQGKTIAQFEYNDNGTLKSNWETATFFMPNKKAEYNYKYNNEGLLVSASGFEPGNMIMSSLIGASDHKLDITFNYFDDGLLKEKTINFYYEEFPEIDFTRNYTYDYPSKETIIETITTNSGSYSYTMGKNEYLFNNKGNIEKETTYNTFDDGIERIISVNEMLYDNKNAPFNQEPIPKSKNNVIEKNIIAYQYNDNTTQTVAYTNTYYYDYEYNKNDYPTKTTETMPSKHVIIKYYQYKK